LAFSYQSTFNFLTTKKYACKICLVMAYKTRNNYNNYMCIKGHIFIHCSNITSSFHIWRWETDNNWILLNLKFSKISFHENKTVKRSIHWEK
jgi:hypothetical protein